MSAYLRRMLLTLIISGFFLPSTLLIAQPVDNSVTSATSEALSGASSAQMPSNQSQPQMNSTGMNALMTAPMQNQAAPMQNQGASQNNQMQTQSGVSTPSTSTQFPPNQYQTKPTGQAVPAGTQPPVTNAAGANAGQTAAPVTNPGTIVSPSTDTTSTTSNISPSMGTTTSRTPSPSATTAEDKMDTRTEQTTNPMPDVAPAPDSTLDRTEVSPDALKEPISMNKSDILIVGLRTPQLAALDNNQTLQPGSKTVTKAGRPVVKKVSVATKTRHYHHPKQANFNDVPVPVYFTSKTAAPSDIMPE